ncbi:hypothetical protein RJ639_008926 [Escallonia herrerae]|uniref:RRM domain-containing protein n=1 Tax=Escallonia herrerae TaxID=1293975 RepID=A0AA88VUN9_9ASTE|nr:hypothetical protein RJ639_008926 [Escallonia herrerae]
MAYQPGPSSGSSSSSGFQFLNSPFGDTTFTKVFVGGLAWETQSATMRRYFEQFGEILEAVVITDKNTGRSKGYGFVTFRDPESAKRACADPTPVIDGRRANCNLASLGRPRPALPFGKMAHLDVLDHRHLTLEAHQLPEGLTLEILAIINQFLTAINRDTCIIHMGEFCFRKQILHSMEHFRGVYNPYMGQQYLQIYGAPGTVNTAIYPYNQLAQTVPSGHGYTALQGYALPGHQIVHFGVATPVPAQPQFIFPAHSSQIMQGSGSDQNAG